MSTSRNMLGKACNGLGSGGAVALDSEHPTHPTLRSYGYQSQGCCVFGLYTLEGSCVFFVQHCLIGFLLTVSH